MKPAEALKFIYEYMKMVINSLRMKRVKNKYIEWLKLPELFSSKYCQPNFTIVLQVICFNYIECHFDEISSILKEEETVEFLRSVKRAHGQIVINNIH